MTLCPCVTTHKNKYFRTHTYLLVLAHGPAVGPLQLWKRPLWMPEECWPWRCCPGLDPGISPWCCPLCHWLAQRMGYLCRQHISKVRMCHYIVLYIEVIIQWVGGSEWVGDLDSFSQLWQYLWLAVLRRWRWGCMCQARMGCTQHCSCHPCYQCRTSLPQMDPPSLDQDHQYLLPCRGKLT